MPPRRRRSETASPPPQDSADEAVENEMRDVVVEALRYTNSLRRKVPRMLEDREDAEESRRRVVRAIYKDMQGKLPAAQIFAALQVFMQLAELAEEYSVAFTERRRARYRRSHDSVDHTVELVWDRWCGEIDTVYNDDSLWKPPSWNPYAGVHSALNALIELLWKKM